MSGNHLMERIYADHTVSVTEFKRDLVRIMRQAAGRPVAVLKNNRPDFYAVPPELFERLADVLDDLLIADEVRARAASNDVVDVELHEL